MATPAPEPAKNRPEWKRRDEGIGDVSYRTLKKAALENLDADDLIDVEIDGHQKSILGIINTVDVVLNAKAIKYTRDYFSFALD